MRKFQIVLVFILISFVTGQTAQASAQQSPSQSSQAPQATASKSTQKMPTKSDPQGYSPYMFEDGKTKSELGHPATYTPASGSADKKIPNDLQAIVREQFGPDFEIAMEKSNGLRYVKPQSDNWVPFLTADLDGDGIEDAIIVTRCKKPLARAVDFNFTVIDPYFTANGFGDPRITATMNSDDPTQNFVVLIIHGAGPQAWRSPTPKSKFAVVNLPFDTLAITHVAGKKKAPPVTALGLDEAETSGSVIFWNGKKYIWRDVGMGGS